VREADRVKLDPALVPRSVAYQWQIASIVPRPIAWTSTLNEDGSANLAPFSYFTGAGSEPPMCLIVVSSHERAGESVPKDTWRNIERTGEFVIHVVPDALAQAMNLTATDFPYGFDEVVAAGLTKLPSERVAAPRIAEAPIAMECRLERIVKIGRGVTVIIVGEILLWHVRDDLMVEGRIDMARLDAVGRMGGSTYTRTRDQFTMTRPRLPKPPGA
jgi:flavin reductase (DIM6/NTAB) family NADH-FMN oxidoreductase RutF